MRGGFLHESQLYATAARAQIPYELVVKDKNDYPERTDDVDPDDRFMTTNVPITAIAVSNGQNDAGLFELNFRDERYLPFEGAGVISKWRLELASKFRQFDYDTMSDVIMTVRYTSMDGGDKLRASAEQSVLAYIKSIEALSQDAGLFAAFDLRHDFPGVQGDAGGWCTGDHFGRPVRAVADLHEGTQTGEHPGHRRLRVRGRENTTHRNHRATGGQPYGAESRGGCRRDEVVQRHGAHWMRDGYLANLAPGNEPDSRELWLLARYVLQ